jgi:deoxycytidylate deaminase
MTVTNVTTADAPARNHESHILTARNAERDKSDCALTHSQNSNCLPISPSPHAFTRNHFCHAEGLGPCAKARVTATITLPDGRVFHGTNDVRNPQASCPRIGQAYARDDFRLCVDVCQQQGHAEAMALRAAGGWAPGAVVRVSHHRCCYACTAALTAAGVARIICEGAPL